MFQFQACTGKKLNFPFISDHQMYVLWRVHSNRMSFFLLSFMFHFDSYQENYQPYQSFKCYLVETIIMKNPIMSRTSISFLEKYDDVPFGDKVPSNFNIWTKSSTYDYLNEINLSKLTVDSNCRFIKFGITT